MSQLFDKTMGSLSTAINMRLLKQNVINSNIANAETPGFHAKKLDFEEALKRALDLSTVLDRNEIDSAVKNVRADIYDNPDVNVSNDGNTVDLEREMASLAENTVLYKAAVQLINRKLGTMKYAVTEGGR